MVNHSLRHWMLAKRQSSVATKSQLAFRFAVVSASYCSNFIHVLPSFIVSCLLLSSATIFPSVHWAPPVHPCVRRWLMIQLLRFLTGHAYKSIAVTLCLRSSVLHVCRPSCPRVPFENIRSAQRFVPIKSYAPSSKGSTTENATSRISRLFLCAFQVFYENSHSGQKLSILIGRGKLRMRVMSAILCHTATLADGEFAQESSLSRGSRWNSRASSGEGMMSQNIMCPLRLG